MNITGYINGLRVALAHQLLKSSRLDIERIAERHRLRLIPAAATRLAALLRLAAHYAARLLRPSRLYQTLQRFSGGRTIWADTWQEKAC